MAMPQLNRVGETDTVRKVRLALCDAMTDQIFGLSGTEGAEPYKAGSQENLILSEVVSLLQQADRLLEGFGD